MYMRVVHVHAKHALCMYAGDTHDKIQLAKLLNLVK